MRLMMYVTTLFLLAACTDEKPTDTTKPAAVNITAAQLATNTTWPYKLTGTLEIGDIHDDGGQDLKIFGTILAGETTVAVEMKGSMLEAAVVNSGDIVEAMIDAGKTESGIHTHKVLEIRKLSE